MCLSFLGHMNYCPENCCLPLSIAVAPASLKTLDNAHGTYLFSRPVLIQSAKSGAMSCEGITSVGVGASTLAQPTTNSVNTQSKGDIDLIISFILFSLTSVSRRSIPCPHNRPCNRSFRWEEPCSPATGTCLFYCNLRIQRIQFIAIPVILTYLQNLVIIVVLIMIINSKDNVKFIIYAVVYWVFIYKLKFPFLFV